MSVKKIVHRPLPWIGYALLLALFAFAFQYIHTELGALQKRVDTLENAPPIITQPVPLASPPPTTPLPKETIHHFTETLRLSLYTLKATSTVNPDLARAQLRALLRWLAPRQKSLNDTYQALLALQKQHPAPDWAAMRHDLQALPKPTHALGRAHPWHSWKHWVHIGPNTTKQTISTHIERAIDEKNISNLSDLLQDSALPNRYQDFANTWSSALSNTAWDIEPTLNTLR
jgi:hypothetical protein